MPSPLALTAAALELTMILAGLILIVRWLVTGGARRHRESAALTAWPSPPTDFAVFLGLVVSGWFVLLAVSGAIAGLMTMSPTARIIFIGGASQVGWLVGALVHRYASGRTRIAPFAADFLPPPLLAETPAPRPAATSLRAIVLPGVAAFLMTLPLLTAVSLAWRYFLTQCGYPVKSQELIGMFKNPESPLLLATMIVLAVVVAPIAEELVFRAGIFRFLRSHVGYALALLAPAIVFSALHGNLASFLPLVVLAVIFSLAYERTGHIGTTMVAHGLFNLNTIVVLLSGVSDITPT